MKKFAIVAVIMGIAAVAWAGAAVPLTWYRSGPVTFGSLFYVTDIQNTVTAHAGGGQSSSASVTHAVTNVTTVASGNDSVTLPAPTAGLVMDIFNSAASNSMQIFAVTPATINGIATGTGIAVAAGKGAHCVAVSSTQWGCVKD